MENDNKIVLYAVESVADLRTRVAGYSMLFPWAEQINIKVRGTFDTDTGDIYFGGYHDTRISHVGYIWMVYTDENGKARKLRLSEDETMVVTLSTGIEFPQKAEV